ncbi:MAG: hypothetical protein WAL85_11205 [Candidatus Korobacteraceae bacterium]
MTCYPALKRWAIIFRLASRDSTFAIPTFSPNLQGGTAGEPQKSQLP